MRGIYQNDQKNILNIGIKAILKLNSFYIQSIKIIIKGVIAYIP